MGNAGEGWKCWLWGRQGQASGKNFIAFRDGFMATARSRVVCKVSTNGDAGMSQQWIEARLPFSHSQERGPPALRDYYRLHSIAPGVGAPEDAEQWQLSFVKLVPVR